MRRAMGRGRRGPGLVGTAARTAVIAGTATAVTGRVAASQAARLGVGAPAQNPPEQAPGPPGPLQSAPSAPLSVEELHEALTTLGALRESGLLTDDEFAAQKHRLLGL